MNYFCVRFNPDTASLDTACDWMVLDDSAQCISSGSHPLGEVSQHCGIGEDLRVIAIVSGDRVLTTDVTVEPQHVAHLKTIIPHLVEEQLAEDLEDVHIALPPQAGVGRNSVAVVSHTELIQWLDLFYSANLQPFAIVPEFLLLPAAEQGVQVLFDNNRAIVQFDKYLGTVLEADNLSTYLDLHFAHQTAHSEPEVQAVTAGSVTLIAQESDTTGMALLHRFQSELTQFPVQTLTLDESAFSQLAFTAVTEQKNSLNLLQGGYRMQQDQPSRLPWRQIAAAAAVFLAAELLLFLGSGWWFTQKSDQLYDAAVAEYRSIFPNEKRVVNPKRQFQGHLNRQQSSSFSAEFLYLTEQLAQAMPPAAMPIRSMQYDAYGDGMILDLTADSLDQIEDYTKALSARNLGVQLLSAVNQGEQVNGRLLVEVI